MLQSHIHIALTTGGTPEFAPIYQWKVTGYQERPQVISSMKRTSSGLLRVHTIQNAAGPILFYNYDMTLKCLDDDTFTARYYKGLLEAMDGRMVQFVDFDHPDTGTDHSAYIKTMYLDINKERAMSTILNYYQIDVTLTDANTVT